MGWMPYNANPYLNDTDDCVVRAVSTFFDCSWDKAYLMVVMQGFKEKQFPNNRNDIWGRMLLEKGLSKYYIPNTCPNCITVEKFANDHPYGRYILCTTTHVIAVINGTYYDTWDSGQEYPVYYFTEKGDL